MLSTLGRWSAVILWMALIFVLSGQSHLPSPEQRWLDFVVEKSSHTIEFGVLAALALNAVQLERRSRWRSLAVAILFTWIYALSDEFHQSFVPGRNADWSDIMFDWLGAVLGAGMLLYRRTARRFQGTA